jgi:hypothetical protein
MQKGAKMPPVDASRNLLFGLLALQNSFIDRDALLDAFNRWARSRGVEFKHGQPRATSVLNAAKKQAENRSTGDFPSRRFCS